MDSLRGEVGPDPTVEKEVRGDALGEREHLDRILLEQRAVDGGTELSLRKARDGVGRCKRNSQTSTTLANPVPLPFCLSPLRPRSGYIVT